MFATDGNDNEGKEETLVESGLCLMVELLISSTLWMLCKKNLKICGTVIVNAQNINPDTGEWQEKCVESVAKASRQTPNPDRTSKASRFVELFSELLHSYSKQLAKTSISIASSLPSSSNFDVAYIKHHAFGGASHSPHFNSAVRGLILEGKSGDSPCREGKVETCRTLACVRLFVAIALTIIQRYSSRGLKTTARKKFEYEILLTASLIGFGIDALVEVLILSTASDYLPIQVSVLLAISGGLPLQFGLVRCFVKNVSPFSRYKNFLEIIIDVALFILWGLSSVLYPYERGTISRFLQALVASFLAVSSGISIHKSRMQMKTLLHKVERREKKRIQLLDSRREKSQRILGILPKTEEVVGSSRAPSGHRSFSSSRSLRFSRKRLEMAAAMRSKINQTQSKDSITKVSRPQRSRSPSYGVEMRAITSAAGRQETMINQKSIDRGTNNDVPNPVNANTGKVVGQAKMSSLSPNRFILKSFQKEGEKIETRWKAPSKSEGVLTDGSYATKRSASSSGLTTTFSSTSTDHMRQFSGPLNRSYEATHFIRSSETVRVNSSAENSNRSSGSMLEPTMSPDSGIHEKASQTSPRRSQRSLRLLSDPKMTPAPIRFRDRVSKDGTNSNPVATEDTLLPKPGVNLRKNRSLDNKNEKKIEKKIEKDDRSSSEDGIVRTRKPIRDTHKRLMANGKALIGYLSECRNGILITLLLEAVLWTYFAIESRIDCYLCNGALTSIFFTRISLSGFLSFALIRFLRMVNSQEQIVSI
eukprot:jgi/Bigna1/79747/fgenesh1_pg.65_\